jgi:hypothetical protein
VLIVDGYIGLVRARRAHLRGDPERRRRYRQHRWRVEGVHGEAKQQHGLRRAARRGLDNVSIQAYLTALVINLKRLAAHAGRFWRDLSGRTLQIARRSLLVNPRIDPRPKIAHSSEIAA